MSNAGTGAVTAAVPQFSVSPGSYASVQTVTLTSTISGARIYYTTNGSTPTTSSTLYSGPITVSNSETIEAITVSPDGSASPVSSASYVIDAQATAPVFSVPAGTYTSVQTVTLTSSTSGAQIYYTTNGTTPSTSSALYNGPITVNASETIEAVAVASNFSSSPVASAAYVINLPAATPTFSIAAGSYSSPQTVALTSSTTGAQIYYTTNGTTPTTSSTQYGGPVTVSSSETIEAIAVATNYATSAVASASYVINLSGVAPPTFSVPSGTYTSSQRVTLGGVLGGQIYYTTDGTTPTTSSLVYTQPITVSSSETIQAFIATPGYGNSPVVSATYVINLLVPAAPVFSVASGTYPYVQVVSLTSNSGVPIYYTTDGTNPDISSNLYKEPFRVSSSETVQAAAVTTDRVSSTVSSASYVIAYPGSLQLNPNALTFFRTGEVYTTTLTNPTSGPITINSIQITPSDWTQVNDCGTSLAANSSCMIAITAGQNYGQFLGTVAVNASDSTEAHAIPLFSDIRMLYQAAPVTNTLGTGWPVTLQNGVAGVGNEAVPMPIYGGVYEGVFSNYDIYEYSGTDIEGEVPANLSVTSCSTKASYTCGLGIYFTPPVGPGSAYVTTNIPGEVYYVTDFGLTSTASFFSPEAVQAPSAAIGQSVTVGVPVQNSSTQTLLFQAPSITTGALNNGDFTLSDSSVYGCQNLTAAALGANYVPACGVGLTFTPTALGTRATVLTLTESNGYTRQILVTGQGVTPSLTVTPSLNFGQQAIGTTSAPLAISVVAANQDGVSASITSQLINGAFALTGPSTCAQGASTCQFQVTFTPPYVTPADGTPYSGTMTLTDTVTGYKTTASLTGLGQ